MTVKTMTPLKPLKDVDDVNEIARSYHVDDIAYSYMQYRWSRAGDEIRIVSMRSRSAWTTSFARHRDLSGRESVTETLLTVTIITMLHMFR